MGPPKPPPRPLPGWLSEREPVIPPPRRRPFFFVAVNGVEYGWIVWMLGLLVLATSPAWLLFCVVPWQ